MRSRAIYTFWSKPEKKASYAWASPQMMLNSWIASVGYARKHFKTIVLRTDKDGLKMLVDGIGIEFDEVVISLENIDETKYPWTICKLLSYRDEARRGPATHLDFDLYVRELKDVSIFDSPIFCQNMEPNVVGTSHYEDSDVLGMKDVPAWYLRWRVENKNAPNCGIIGWNNCEFMEWFATQAIDFLDKNKGGKWGVNAIVPEQAFLGAAMHHKGIAARTFYKSWPDFYDNAIKTGIDHLIAARKTQIGNEMALNEIAKQMRPDQWKRAQEVGREISKEGNKCHHLASQMSI